MWVEVEGSDGRHYRIDSARLGWGPAVKWGLLFIHDAQMATSACAAYHALQGIDVHDVVQVWEDSAGAHLGLPF